MFMEACEHMCLIWPSVYFSMATNRSSLAGTEQLQLPKQTSQQPAGANPTGIDKRRRGSSFFFS